MEEGFDIPIGGDMSGLNAALASIPAAFANLGNKITAAFEKSNAAVSNTANRFAAVTAATSATAAATNSAGASAATAASKFAAVASTAGAVGNAFSGMNSAFSLAGKASRALAAINLATSLGQWISKAGGIRAAFQTIPNAMSTIARNPTFRKIAIGAGIAVGGILTIRTAWRTVSSSFSLIGRTASRVFHGISSGARKAAGAIGGVFRGMASMATPALPLAGLLGGVGGIAGAVGLAVKSIGKAADFETLETAFAPLLGGTKAAKDRIQELSQFAAATPFELPEVAAASRTLEVLTKGALATGTGLRRVGDIAAGVNAPFEDIAVTIGRLYDGLQSGRPVGEVMMRLQELGAISGNTRTQIEALQKSGAAGAGIWKIAEQALSRFDGSMSRQSVTWNGKLSTLRDEISRVMAAFGKPIMDSLKPYLDSLTDKVRSLKNLATDLGDKIKNAFDFGFAAFQTGKITEILGAETKLAFYNGINVLFAGLSNSMSFLSSSLQGIMSAFADGFKESGLTDILKFAAEGMGYTIAAAVNDALSNIPGLGDLKKQAKFDRQAANENFGAVGDLLPYMDLGAGLEAFSETLKTRLEQVRKNFNEALANPLIDTTKASAEAQTLRDKVKEQVEKNQAAIARDAAELDAGLKTKGSPGSASLADKVTKATQPAIMSLTRIGGGGFASTVMGNLYSEAKRQTTELRKLVAQGERSSTSTAVYG